MTLGEAIRIAVMAHEGQTDKGGQPYILHPLRVMLQMDNDIERMAAVLHDVLEDAPQWRGELRGADSEVWNALNALTKQPGERYIAYLSRVVTDPIAINVKRADLRDNLRPCHDDETEAGQARRNKYHFALDLLTPA